MKQRLQGSIFFYGGDATENDDFQRGKQRLQGSFFSFGDNFQWGRPDEKSRFPLRKSDRAWLCKLRKMSIKFLEEFFE